MPVAPVVTGVNTHDMFHIRCVTLYTLAFVYHYYYYYCCLRACCFTKI